MTFGLQFRIVIFTRNLFKNNRQKEAAAKMKKNFTGIATALGAGIGAAVGSALHNIPVWLAVGVAIGISIGAMIDSPDKQKPQ